MTRRADVKRQTAETSILVSMDLDGTGKADIRTGIGFFDHMLHQIARHGQIDLTVMCDGDLHIDGHHSVEDIGIAMGALGSALAIEAADIILLEDELPKIVDAIKISKETLRVVNQNIAFAIAVKVIIVLLALVGYFGMWEAIVAEVGVVFAAIMNAVYVVKYYA